MIPNTPSEADQLRENLMERTAALRARRDDLMAGVARVPEKIETEDDASRLTDFIKQITGFIKACDEAEKDLKLPHRTAITIMGAFFTHEFACMNRAKAMLLERQTVFLKECAEIDEKMQRAQVRGDFGSVATLRHRWTFEVIDYRKVDYVLLAQYFDREAVDKALRNAIAHGVRDVTGVRIFKEEKAIVS